MKRAAFVLAAAAIVSGAHADEHHDSAGPPVNAIYNDECGGCHLPFPPRLLPVESWRRLMADLPHHFGSDASIELAVRQSLTVWLEGNAGRRRADAPPQDRITRSTWFVREHREVAPEAWRRTGIKSAANCSACHGGAATGDFDEHAVRIPR